MTALEDADLELPPSVRAWLGEPLTAAERRALDSGDACATAEDTSEVSPEFRMWLAERYPEDIARIGPRRGMALIKKRIETLESRSGGSPIVVLVNFDGLDRAILVAQWEAEHGPIGDNLVTVVNLVGPGA